ncbi:MAG: 30S ribosomal protein S6 [Anaerolineae bacterium]|nr:30S ribosomal protein S6 [Anaerolineae bacterium]
MRKYELVFIIRPDVAEEAVTAAIEQVKQWVTAQSGEVQRVEQWGRRRLAYPINDQREGHYVLFNLMLAPQAIDEVERNLKLSDVILRHLLVRVEE